MEEQLTSIAHNLELLVILVILYLLYQFLKELLGDN